jgi:hypothetical protein
MYKTQAFQLARAITRKTDYLATPEESVLSTTDPYPPWIVYAVKEDAPKIMINGATLDAYFLLVQVMDDLLNPEEEPTDSWIAIEVDDTPGQEGAVSDEGGV